MPPPWVSTWIGNTCSPRPPLISHPAVLSQLRGSLDGQPTASQRKARFVIETQQLCKFVISNVTFKAVKSMDRETTDTKARRWSIRGLKGLIFPLSAFIIEGGKWTHKITNICRLLESDFLRLWTAHGHNWWRSHFLEGRHYISKPHHLNLPTEC